MPWISSRKRPKYSRNSRYRLMRGSSGKKRYHLIIPKVRHTSRLEDTTNITQENYNYFISRIQQENLLNSAEERIPRLAGAAIRRCYPGDPIAQYLIGEIVEETTLFAIVVLRSRMENSEVSLMQLTQNHFQGRFYERTRVIRFVENIPQHVQTLKPILFLDFRN